MMFGSNRFCWFGQCCMTGVCNCGATRNYFTVEVFKEGRSWVHFKNLFPTVPDIILKFCICFQGKRDESTTVDTEQAKEDAKVQSDACLSLFQTENIFTHTVITSLCVESIFNCLIIFYSDSLRSWGEEVGNRRI